MSSSLNLSHSQQSWFAPVWNAISSLFGGAPQTGNRALEACQAREMARRLQHSDPGVAADLFAAADRHEMLSR
jgi:hypothetical protein